jgi:hypothetical protein
LQKKTKRIGDDKIRPPLAKWTRGLTEADRNLAERWLAQAGQESFARIADAFARAPRSKGRTPIDDDRPLREVARLLVENREWKIHRAATFVADRICSANDWRDRPPVGKASLRNWIIRAFNKRSVELLRAARSDAARKSQPAHSSYGIPTSGNDGAFVWHPLGPYYQSLLERHQRDDSALEPYLKLQRQIDLIERSDPLRHLSPWSRFMLEEIERQVKMLDLADPLRRYRKPGL